MFGVLFSDGNVALLVVPTPSDNTNNHNANISKNTVEEGWDPREMYGRWLQITDATCISLSSRHRRIAVGKATGDVILLNIDEEVSLH